MRHGLAIGKRKLYACTCLTREHLPEAVQALLRHAPSLWYVTISTPAGGGHRGRSKVIPASYLHEPSRLLAATSNLTTTLEAQLSTKHLAILRRLTQEPHLTPERLSQQLKAAGLPVSKSYIHKVKRMATSPLTTTLVDPSKRLAILHRLNEEPHLSAEHLSQQLTAQGLPVTKRYVNKVKRIYFTGRPPCKPL
jgi:hypothetical protein